MTREGGREGEKNGGVIQRQDDEKGKKVGGREGRRAGGGEGGRGG